MDATSNHESWKLAKTSEPTAANCGADEAGKKHEEHLDPSPHLVKLRIHTVHAVEARVDAVATYQRNLGIEEAPNTQT